jgi:hypothetical protein
VLDDQLRKLLTIHKLDTNSLVLEVLLSSFGRALRHASRGDDHTKACPFSFDPAYELIHDISADGRIGLPMLRLNSNFLPESTRDAEVAKTSASQSWIRDPHIQSIGIANTEVKVKSAIP